MIRVRYDHVWPSHSGGSTSPAHSCCRVINIWAEQRKKLTPDSFQMCLSWGNHFLSSLFFSTGIILANKSPREPGSLKYYIHYYIESEHKIFIWNGDIWAGVTPVLHECRHGHFVLELIRYVYAHSHNMYIHIVYAIIMTDLSTLTIWLCHDFSLSLTPSRLQSHFSRSIHELVICW